MAAAEFVVDGVDDLPFVEGPQGGQKLLPGTVAGEAVDQGGGMELFHEIHGQPDILLLAQHPHFPRPEELGQRGPVDDVKQMDLDAVHPQPGHLGGGFQHHGVVFPRQPEDDVDTDPQTPLPGSGKSRQEGMVVVAAMDEIQGAVMDALQTKLQPEIGGAMVAFQQIQDFLTQTVGTGADRQAQDIRHGQGLVETGPELRHRGAGVGVGLEIGQKTTGPVFADHDLLAVLDLVADGGAAFDAGRARALGAAEDAAGQVAGAAPVGAGKPGVNGDFMNPSTEKFFKMVGEEIVRPVRHDAALPLRGRSRSFPVQNSGMVQTMPAQSRPPVRQENVPSMRIKLIANPTAGRRGPEAIETIRTCLVRAGCEVDLRVTGCRGDAERAAAQAGREGFDRILVAGGDGTLNEAINGLVPSPVPLGFVPLGTANVLALETGIPREIPAAVEAFLHGTPIRIFTGLAGSRRFLLMAGIGFDAEAVLRMNPVLKRLSGKLAYVVSGLRILCRGPAFPITVTLENGDRIPAHGAILSNVKRYGGDFQLFPAASLEEPCLDLCLFLRLSRLDLLRCLWRLAWSRPVDSPRIRRFKARQVRVEGESAALQLDGDPCGRLPVTLTCSTDELWLVRPG